MNLGVMARTLRDWIDRIDEIGQLRQIEEDIDPSTLVDRRFLEELE